MFKHYTWLVSSYYKRGLCFVIIIKTNVLFNLNFCVLWKIFLICPVNVLIQVILWKMVTSATCSKNLQHPKRPLLETCASSKISKIYDVPITIFDFGATSINTCHFFPHLVVTTIETCQVRGTEQDPFCIRQNVTRRNNINNHLEPKRWGQMLDEWLW